MAARRNKDIGRLDVAVSDALRVRRIQPIGNLDREVEQFVDLYEFRPDPVLEGLPFEILHRNEGLAFIFADLINGANMGMVESRGGARFTLKAFQSLAVLGEMFGQELQGDESAELGVFGLVDYTHTTAAEFLKYPVVRDGSTCMQFFL